MHNALSVLEHDTEREASVWARGLEVEHRSKAQVLLLGVYFSL